MTDREIEWAQRLAILELKVQNLGTDLATIDKKLDSLLELRSKGMGVFWVASLMFGGGFVGALTWLISRIRGH